MTQIANNQGLLYKMSHVYRFITIKYILTNSKWQAHDVMLSEGRAKMIYVHVMGSSGTGNVPCLDYSGSHIWSLILFHNPVLQFVLMYVTTKDL